MYHVTCLGKSPAQEFRKQARLHERGMPSFDPILPLNPQNKTHPNAWSAVVNSVKSAASAVAHFVASAFRKPPLSINESSSSSSIPTVQTRPGVRRSTTNKKANAEPPSPFRNCQHSALKVVAKSGLANSTCGPDLVRNEVRLHSMAKHPGIVRMHAAWEDAYQVYMLLDLMAGPTLQHFLCSRQRLTEPEAASYASQILDTLSYLHGRNIIHKDLTLSNLILSADKKRVRLCDFGLSEEVQDGSDSVQSPLRGTPDFVAPELLSNSSENVAYYESYDLNPTFNLF